MDDDEDCDSSLEAFCIQWIGLETAEKLPPYIIRYYQNLHVKVSKAKLSHIKITHTHTHTHIHTFIQACTPILTQKLLTSIQFSSGTCKHFYMNTPSTSNYVNSSSDEGLTCVYIHTCEYNACTLRWVVDFVSIQNNR